MDYSAKTVVTNFIRIVRSGAQPERAKEFMASKVIAHQITSGVNQIIERSPKNYTEHVHEFLTCYGQFELEIEECLCDGDKVYVRWLQKGKHMTEIMGFEATGKPLDTFGSAVYRVQDGLIVEYWIQQENYGLLEQLERNRTQD